MSLFHSSDRLGNVLSVSLIPGRYLVPPIADLIRNVGQILALSLFDAWTSRQPRLAASTDDVLWH